MLEDESQFKDLYKIGDHDIKIPFDKLDDLEALQNIDLTYYQNKCREVLKIIYDSCFKTHRGFTELRNNLI
jgi:hypothetical protein